MTLRNAIPFLSGSRRRAANDPGAAAVSQQQSGEPGGLDITDASIRQGFLQTRPRDWLTRARHVSREPRITIPPAGLTLPQAPDGMTAREAPPYLPPEIWQRIARLSSPLGSARLAATCKAACEGVRLADVWAGMLMRSPNRAATMQERLNALAPWQQAHLRTAAGTWEEAGAQWQCASVQSIFRLLLAAHEVSFAGYIVNLSLSQHDLRDRCAQNALPIPNLRPLYLHCLPLAIASAQSGADAWQLRGETDWAEGCLKSVADYQRAYSRLQQSG